MDSLNHPSSKPFHLPSLSSSFTDYDLNSACTNQLAQASSNDLPSIFNYPLSPLSTISNNQSKTCPFINELDQHEPSCSPKEGWAHILEKISRGVNPTQIIEDYDDPSVVISANHNNTDISDILNLLGMKDSTSNKEAVYSDSLRSSFSLSALDWEYYGLNQFGDDQAQAKSSSYSGSEAKTESLIHSGSKSSSKGETEQIESQNSRPSWQQQTYKAGQTSWQEKIVGETRASWQHGTRDEGRKKAEKIRASWQYDSEQQAASCISNMDEGACDIISKVFANDIVEGSEMKASWRGYSSLIESNDINKNGLIPEGSSMKATTWAGPTLMDIEAALADTMSDSPSSVNYVNSSVTPSSHVNHVNSSVTLSCQSSSTDPCSLCHVLLSKAHQQEAITHPLHARNLLPLELPARSKEILNEQVIIDASWRSRLQKRNNIGPKNTIQVRSEEEALADGYRWRKYGQKAIKNCLFPRCTSGKCNAKKQVERCEGDEALFMVTYEGMHLHHKPNPLRKLRMKSEHKDKMNQKSFIMCSPTSSTHGSSYNVDSTNIEPLFSSSLPTSPLSPCPKLDIPLNFDNFAFLKSPSPQPLHNDAPLYTLI